MVFKFQTSVDTVSRTHTNNTLEFSTSGKQLLVVSDNGETDASSAFLQHFVDRSEIDKMIFALQEIKKEIEQKERSNVVKMS